ncbi:MAG: gfo/Idh/MocA family oxidoreductase, partial [Isosphaeraceae bacterium]
MKTPSTHGSSRRDFLAGASGVASLGASPWIGRAAASANDRIGIGLVGVGGRGTDHLKEIVRLASSRNVRVTAV